MINFPSMLCKRLNVKELVSSILVYETISSSILKFRRIGEQIGSIFNFGVCDSSEGSSGGLNFILKRWATKKTAGSTKNGRDSKPKNLGVKKYGGEKVILGNIIVRQRDTQFHPRNYVRMGKDHTLFAFKEGKVKFETHKLSGHKWVHVEPKDAYELHPLYAK